MARGVDALGDRRVVSSIFPSGVPTGLLKTKYFDDITLGMLIHGDIELHSNTYCSTQNPR